MTDPVMKIELPYSQMCILHAQLRAGVFELVAPIVQAFEAQFLAQIENYQRALAAEQAAADAATRMILWRTLVTVVIVFLAAVGLKSFHDTTWANTACIRSVCTMTTDAAWTWMLLSFSFGAIAGAALILERWFRSDRKASGRNTSVQ